MSRDTSSGATIATNRMTSQNIARKTCPRPSRGPSYRWYPMSWMTLASDIGRLPRGEELGDAVTSLVEAVQRQIEIGHGPQDAVVRGVGLQGHQQQPAVPAHRQTQRGEGGGELVRALAD